MTLDEGDAIRQEVRAVAGHAYGVVGADIHVFGDASPAYLLFEHRRTDGLDPMWLRAQPSRMLDARAEVVEFTGRDSEVEQLTVWRDMGPRFAVRWLHGEGGQGKTRLAAQFAALSQAAGWKAVDAVHGTDAHAPAPASQDLRLNGHHGVLILVDYADRWPLSDLAWLFHNRLLRQPVPARVLLIARSAQGWRALRGKLDQLRENIDTSAQYLEPPSHNGRARELMFAAARDCFARAYPELGDASLLAPPESLGLPDFALTLAVHMAALVAVDAAAQARGAPADLLGLTVYLLDREHENWRQLYENAVRGLDLHTSDTLMARMVFIATLIGATDHAAAHDVLSTVLPGVPATQSIKDHAQCYPPTDPARTNVLEPLLPDRLAEDFLALTLPGSPATDYPTDDWAAGTVRTLLRAEPAAMTLRYTPRALTFLASTAARWPHVGREHLFPQLAGNPAVVRHANSAAITALAELADLPVELMQSMDEHFPDRRSDLDVGIAEFTRRRVERRLAAEPEPTEQARLWSALAYRLSIAGQVQEALPAANQAVAIHEALGAGQEGDLAEALNLLGIVLSDLGRPAEALDHADRAVELSRRLATADAAHSADLARHLLNRGSHRHDLGRWADMLEDSTQATDIRELLADKDPQATADFADALHNLSLQLSTVGRDVEALDRSGRAAELYRELAEREPLVHRPRLATVLSNLSARLAELGRDSEAVKAVDEAVALFRSLTKLNPAYKSGLAEALNNLAGFSATLHRGHAAEEAAGEAVALYRELARTNVGYVRRFADSLDNLCFALRRTRQFEAALVAGEEALAILRTLVLDNRAAHEVALADSLINRSAILTELGRPEDALDRVDEAIAIYRRRIDGDVADKLATALRNRGLILTLVGRPAEAVEPAQQAVTILRRLAERSVGSHAVELAGALVGLGLVLVTSPHVATAPEAFEEAVEIYRRLGDPYEPDLGDALRNLGLLQMALGLRDAAVTAVEEAAQIHERLAGIEPARQEITADLWINLGLLRWRLGQPSAALAATQRAVDLGRTLVAQDPAHRLRLAMALQNLAVFLGLRGQRTTAVSLARERQDLLHAMAQADPERFNPGALGSVLGQAAVLTMQDEDQTSVRAELIESLELSRELIRVLSADRVDEMRVTWSAVAEVFVANGQTELAREIHRQLV